MKLCKDCVHCRPMVQSIGFGAMRNYDYAKCAAFPSPVTGEAEQFCEFLRKERGLCGIEPERFELKPEPRRPWWGFWR